MLLLRRYAPAGIVLGAALLSLAQINQHLILASDNSIYVVLGQALAMGRGYVMVNDPNAPAMNLYPFGYPLLLAAALKLAGAVATPMQAIVPMKLISVVFYLACLPVFFAYARRRYGEIIAVAATVLFAANPAVQSLATDILSETPFVFFTLLGLYVVDRSEGTRMATEKARVTSDEQPGRFSGAIRALRVHPRSVDRAALLLAAALALGTAYYMRTAELAILGAVPVFLVIKRQVRTGLALAALLAAFTLPWFLRSSAPPSPETPFFARSYIHQVLTEAPYSDKTVRVLGLVQRVIGNSWDYLGRILPETLFPHLPSLGVAAPLISIAIAVLLVLGFAMEVRRGLRAGELAIAAYWLSLSLFVWVLGYRYIILILPFAILYLLVAVESIAAIVWRTRAVETAASARPHRSSIALLLITGVLMLSSLAVDARRAERNLLATRRQTLAQTYAGDLEWTRYLAAVDWIKQDTPSDAVVMARKPELVYLLSGRRAVEYPYTQDGSILMSTIAAGGVSYVLEDAFTWTRTTETYLAPAMRTLPAAFALVQETPPPRTRIWKVTASP